MFKSSGVFINSYAFLMRVKTRSFTLFEMSQTTENENWTTIIKPRNKLFEVNLKEIWDYRDLLMLFVKRTITVQYKQTILGPLWWVIQPAFTVIMYMVVFGGIALSAVNPSTLESRHVPHLFFAGEALDIDGITGGFNFQAAWTTAYTVACAIRKFLP